MDSCSSGEDYRIRVATIEYKENDESSTEIYLLTAEVAEYLKQTSPEEITYATLYLACNRQGDIFIWPCRDPRADSKMGRDVAATTRIEAAEAAMERQVRVQWRSPAYEISFRDDSIPDVEPVWPKEPLSELVNIGFVRMGLLIKDTDHAVIKILQGRN
jgi:hypothetical protein